VQERDGTREDSAWASTEHLQGQDAPSADGGKERARKNLHLARVRDVHSSEDGLTRPSPTSSHSGSVSPELEWESPNERAAGSPFAIMPFARRVSGNTHAENTTPLLVLLESLDADGDPAAKVSCTRNDADETTGVPCSPRGASAWNGQYQITTVHDCGPEEMNRVSRAGSGGVFDIAHVNDCGPPSEVSEDHALSEISQFKTASSIPDASNGPSGGASEVDDACAGP
jgi:hypothetical protein